MNNVTYAGPGIFSLLGVAFIILKLCGVINWSWWIVLLPFILQIIIAICVLIIVLIVMIIFWRRI
jgi:hypothetical protein